MIPSDKNLISVILPCYNEEAILKENLNTIVQYLREKNYKWEVLLINDGSKDRTGEIADECAKEIEDVRVIHHPVNLNLGRALQTGFRNADGDILIVLDVDLSYSVEHIGRMIEKMNETGADMVIASPYMK